MRYVLFSILVVISSCTKNQEKSKGLEVSDSSNVALELIERDFPDNFDSETFDTLLTTYNLQIKIIRTPLESFVTDEFESGSERHIDRYHDYSSQIIIKKDDKTLLDSTLTKSNFTEYTNDEFRQIATFNGHQFSEIKDGEIKLFGSIGKPETDWQFAFDHVYNLNSGELTLVEHKHEEI